MTLKTQDSSIRTIYPSEKVVIREVGLRDGLQITKKFPTTEAKKRWIDAEYAAGVRHFEIGSYLPSASFPQFADIDELADHIDGLDGAFSTVCTLNKKGAIRAFEGCADEIVCVISASERHNQRNANRTRQEGLQQVREIIRLRENMERKPFLTLAIAMAFGCTIQGKVDSSEVLWLVEEAMQMGFDGIALADTVGFAGPNQIKALVRDVRAMCNTMPILLHLHDTRGMGIANVAAALEEGIFAFDASLGGLGGCPFAPNATGNVVIEDVAFLCEQMGFSTGIDIEALIDVRSILNEQLPEETLYGALAKAGLPMAESD